MNSVTTEDVRQHGKEFGFLWEKKDFFGPFLEILQMKKTSFGILLKDILVRFFSFLFPPFYSIPSQF